MRRYRWPKKFEDDGLTIAANRSPCMNYWRQGKLRHEVVLKRTRLESEEASSMPYLVSGAKQHLQKTRGDKSASTVGSSSEGKFPSCVYCAEVDRMKLKRYGLQLSD
jgi:hypothetical protein